MMQDHVPKWEGDLDDDCSARWSGFLLRAECMEESVWWWAVYRESGEEIDSSNNHEVVVSSGEAARKAAEVSAQKFVSPNYDII
jgi:hypothetical protein